MGMGPVDIIIIEFPGNKFTGRIAPAIVDLVDRGVVRILDLLFVTKDIDGVVAAFEIADIDGDGIPDIVSLEVAEAGTLDREDAEEIADDLAPNSSALLVAFENVWAAEFTDAIRAADARVLDQVRIPAAVADDFFAGR